MSVSQLERSIIAEDKAVLKRCSQALSSKVPSSEVLSYKEKISIPRRFMYCKQRGAVFRIFANSVCFSILFAVHIYVNV